MFKMPLSTLVQIIAKTELAKIKEGEALHLHFDVRMNDFFNDSDASRSAGIHLLFSCSPGSNYITVFSAVTDSPFDEIKKVKEWTHESTHDSCWRDIKIFNDVYFGMAKELNEERKKRGFATKGPMEFNKHVGFAGVKGEMSRWVKVKIMKDPTDLYSYRRTVEVLP